MMQAVYALVRDVCIEFAPDPRSSVYEVYARREEGSLVLRGYTSEPGAAERLHERVAELDLEFEVRDEVMRLPLTNPDFLKHGIIMSARAPMLAGPLISERPVSQVVMGQRVLVLRDYRRWLQCRTPDGYIGWIHHGYLHRAEETEARSWELGTEAPLHLSLGAQIVGEDGEPRHRIPWGGRVGYRDGEGFLADGTRGELRGEVIPMAELHNVFPSTGESVLKTAGKWLGAPYFWGGITPEGADCSGLVQAILNVHGTLLPRDSDMQARIGEKIDPGEDFAGVHKGDLLFFAEPGRRVSHVAFSEGGSGIIHSALENGGVRRNDLLGDRLLEVDLRRRLVGVRRVIGRERSMTGPPAAFAAQSGG